MDRFRELWRGKTTPKESGGEFNNVWVEGDLIHSDGRYYIHPIANTVRLQGELGRLIVMHEVSPETLDQCTGRFDKNGKPIFENEAVRDTGSGAVGVIKYGKYIQPFNDDKFTKHVGFYVEWCDEQDKALLRKDLGYWEPYIEIIGNVRDTPEILKNGGAANE